MVTMLINYYGNMEASKKKTLIVSGIVLATLGLGILAYSQLKKKGIEIKIGR